MRFHPLRRKSLTLSAGALGAAGEVPWLCAEGVLAGRATEVMLVSAGLVSRVAVGVLVLL